MTPVFSEGMPRLYAIAAQILKWSPSRFWAATPEELFSGLADPRAEACGLIDRDELEQLMELERDG